MMANWSDRRFPYLLWVQGEKAAGVVRQIFIMPGAADVPSRGRIMNATGYRNQCKKPRARAGSIHQPLGLDS